MSVESSGIGRKIIPGKRPQFLMYHAKSQLALIDSPIF
jgi:hypothetical protein